MVPPGDGQIGVEDPLLGILERLLTAQGETCARVARIEERLDGLSLQSGEVSGIRERLAGLEHEDRHTAELLAQECPRAQTLATVESDVASWVRVRDWFRWASKTSKAVGKFVGKFVVIPAAVIGLILKALQLAEVL